MATYSQSPMPPAARERIRHQKELRARGEGIFHSTLTFNELLLTARGGYLPIGQVLGASVFQSGPQWSSDGGRLSNRERLINEGVGWEQTIATAAWLSPRRAAIERMRQEAVLLGANVVAGVTLKKSRVGEPGPSGTELVEFVARGTAMADRTAKPKAPTAPKFHAASNLSGAELWELRQAGYEPLGLVLGNCCYRHFASRRSSALIRTSLNHPGLTTEDVPVNPFGGTGLPDYLFNTEIADVTQAIYAARSLAMERINDAAREIKADGVVGIFHESHFRKAHMEETNRSAPLGISRSYPISSYPIDIEFFVMGTAIRRMESPMPSPGIVPVVGMG